MTNLSRLESLERECSTLKAQVQALQGKINAMKESMMAQAETTQVVRVLKSRRESFLD